jgi:hypothetical protein
MTTLWYAFSNTFFCFYAKNMFIDMIDNTEQQHFSVTVSSIHLPVNKNEYM